jgi:4-hydroxybenzoate polyprenyltransferase
LSSLRKYIRLTRPFTLAPPLLGVVSGAITAWGSAHNPYVLSGLPRTWTTSILVSIVVGSACAALMNAASNIINQYYDLENDRINKPNRLLVTGEVSTRNAWILAFVLYLFALIPTWWVTIFPHDSFADRTNAPPLQHEVFWIYLIALVFTFMYSAPQFGRTKQNAFLAALTMAIPRGGLLKVAGWGMVASVMHLEPWFIGTIFFLFILGASATKDFSDMKGDEAAGCITFPIRFGVVRAAKMISPFFVLPWALIPLGAWIPDPFNEGHAILTGDKTILMALGIGLMLYGLYAVRLILKDPQALADVENHPSWTHMYIMMMVAQFGFAAAYLL